MVFGSALNRVRVAKWLGVCHGPAVKEVAENAGHDFECLEVWFFESVDGIMKGA